MLRIVIASVTLASTPLTGATPRQAGVAVSGAEFDFAGSIGLPDANGYVNDAMVRLCRSADHRTEASLLSGTDPQVAEAAVDIARGFAPPRASGPPCRVVRLQFRRGEDEITRPIIEAAPHGVVVRNIPSAVALRLCDGCRRPRGAPLPAGVARRTWTSMRVCADGAGYLRSMKIQKSAGASADAASLAEVSRWQFRPLEIDGARAGFCSIFRVEF